MIKRAGSTRVNVKRAGSTRINVKHAGSTRVNVKRAGSTRVNVKRAGSIRVNVLFCGEARCPGRKFDDFSKTLKLNFSDNCETTNILILVKTIPKMLKKIILLVAVNK